MFGHKCFLRLGQLNDSSISGLYKDSYELLSCDYSFAKGTDRNGKPQTEVRGGTIKVCYPNVPQPEFMGWMLKSGKLENGAIVICDRSEEHTSELQSRPHLVCRLLLEKKKKTTTHRHIHNYSAP